MTNQQLLDAAALADVNEAIRQGLDDVLHGRTRPAREVFDQIRRKYAIPIDSADPVEQDPAIQD